jgi:hypothetical protein
LTGVKSFIVADRFIPPNPVLVWARTLTLRPSVSLSTDEILDVETFFADWGPNPLSARGVLGGKAVVDR